MPWNDDGQNPKGQNPTGQNPWGSPPGGGNGSGRPSDRPGPRPTGPWGPGGGTAVPDFDELISRAQTFLRRKLSGGGGPTRGGRGGGGGGGWIGGGRGLALLAVAIIAVWLASGFYRVQPDEQGVVLRFGAFSRIAQSGLNYHIPWPVESVMLPAVTRINRIEVGYRSSGPDLRSQSGRDLPSRAVPEESLMLTGDENIIDIDFAVLWRISNAKDFLFNTRNPEVTVKAVAESVMREVIGRTPIQPALTDARAQIETAVRTSTQSILDQYGAGVEITQVQLQKVDPPAAVIDSFRDVQRANTEAERTVNEAQAYSNDIIPRARGQAASITAAAEGARQSSIAEATGQSQRFLSVLAAYDAAKDVTLRRLYIETMEQILQHTPTIVLDDQAKNVVPYLPLTQPNPPPAAPAAPVSPSVLGRTP
jgi:membrane protease subunit HflK